MERPTRLETLRIHSKTGPENSASKDPQRQRKTNHAKALTVVESSPELVTSQEQASTMQLVAPDGGLKDGTPYHASWPSCWPEANENWNGCIKPVGQWQHTLIKPSKSTTQKAMRETFGWAPRRRERPRFGFHGPNCRTGMKHTCQAKTPSRRIRTIQNQRCNNAGQQWTNKWHNIRPKPIAGRPHSGHAPLQSSNNLRWQ